MRIKDNNASHLTRLEMSQNRFFATALAAQASPALLLDSDASGQRVPVQVLCGWDRPLQYFFLNVETYVPHYPQLEVSVFDNLRHGDGSMTLAEVLATLGRLGITYPEGLEAALQDQQARNAGNESPEWPSVAAQVEVVAPRQATVEPWRLPAPTEAKWSGKSFVPLLGQNVTIHMNSIGAGKVQGYFHLDGWLGVLVNVPNLPEWYCKGQSPKPHPHVYGRELEPYS